MSNKIGLIGMVLMCLFFYKHSLAKTSTYAYNVHENTQREVWQDTDTVPAIVFGKPHDLTQCAGPSSVDPATFYLPDAVKGKAEKLDNPDNSEVDIVPFGYRYAFYLSQSDAEAQQNELTAESLWVKLQRTSENVIYFVRVYSVLDPTLYKISSFTLFVKKQDCTIQDFIVSVGDLYQSVDSPDQPGIFNLAGNANRALLGNIVEYDVRLFQVLDSGVKQEILNQNKAWENFSASNNTVIEIQATNKKDGSVDVGSKRFVLYTEYLDVNLQVSLLANQSNDQVEESKREGIFNLQVAKDSIGKDKGIYAPYLFVEYFKDPSRREKIDNPLEYTATNGSKVYTKISNLLFNAKPVVVKYGEVELKIVNKPIIGDFENLTQCTDDLTQWRFDLLTLNQDILGDYPPADAQETTGYKVAYFDTEQDAIDNQNERSNSLNVSINQLVKVWVRLTDLETGNFNHTSVTASLGYDGIRAYNGSISYCYSSTNQNTTNLYGAKNIVVGNSSLNQEVSELYPSNDLLDVLFFENETDAQNNVNALSRDQASSYPLQIGVKKTLYARVTMIEGFSCESNNYSKLEVSTNLQVDGKAFPNVPILQLCSNGENQGEIGSTVWFEPDVAGVYKVDLVKQLENSNVGTVVDTKVGSNAMELSFELTQPGNYWLRAQYASNPYPDTPACSFRSITWSVKPVFQVLILNADATNMINSFDVDEKGRAFVEIGVDVEDDSDFQYAIDNGVFQEFNRFENIPIGDHVAWVRSKSNGCAVMKVFSVFGYPRFFTPNGDGYNDTWNIPGLAGHPEARVTIFDRNGRLLKQMSPNNGQGWDGTFNGRELPSTDYWFSVEFTNDLPGNSELNGRQVKYTGHFSLKR
ncbi:T9SS type B sorting domain-containing protein [Myroides sp. LJL119]